MSVTLSPIGGVAQQFFDNNGQPLSGGKIYTYAAGTTTPLACYTSATGATPHSNPIILDSAGRVPGGEIWLTDSLMYKFVIYTSLDILLGSYDNITGINSNFVNYATQEEIQTATAGQTVFTLTTMTYLAGTNSLMVFVDGVNQYAGDSFIETDNTTVTFTSGLHVGAEVKFTTAIALNTSTTVASAVAFNGFNGQTGNVQNLSDNDGSDWIGYAPLEITGIARSAQDKMRDFVSVKDFGAIGDGVTDDTAAFQAAIDSGSQYISVPNGMYIISDTILISSASAVREIVGLGFPTLVLDVSGAAKIFEVQSGKQFLSIDNFSLESTGTKSDAYDTYGIYADTVSYVQFNNIRATDFSGAGLECRGSAYVGLYNFTASSCTYGLSLARNGVGSQNTAVNVNRAYISGCERGFFDDGGVDIVATSIVLEYCGNAVSLDGALHLLASTIVLTYPYWEANYRNVVASDAIVQMANAYGWGSGSAADSIVYVGIAAANRGWTVNSSYQINAANLKADTYTNRDLTIGENLIVPVTGGSVNFGGQTMETVKGTASSGIWTTVKALSGQTGDGGARKTYRYSIYAGRGDLTTGYDSGVVLNGTLYSDSGSTPAWLRVNSNNLQVNITSSSYGLDYGCTLTVIEGIGAP